MTKRPERLLLASGMVFLVMWCFAEIYRTIASRAAIQQFQAKEAQMLHRDANSSFDFNTDSKVNFQLWSARRIEAFGESLYRENVAPLAILRIPRIELEVPVFNGTDDLTLDRGVGRILGTVKVGQTGNLGIAGHRDGFFRGLKDLELGDAIEINRPRQFDRYIVSQIRIVEPNDVSVLAPTTKRTLTLVTCFPFYYIGSAPKRFIVTASIQDVNLQN